MAIAPRTGQLHALADPAPDGRLALLTLLECEARAEDANGRQTGLMGAEACRLYAGGAGRMIADPGRRGIFGGGQSA